MQVVSCLAAGLLAVQVALAYHFSPELDDWNLNKNQYAIVPEQYSGEWVGHRFTASPKSWRFPFYTVMLDRFANGDPHNDNINGTLFERDSSSTQLRYGGDVLGLIDSLDYIQGMGVKGLYLAGSFFMNLPWTYDMYSPVDLTLLDQHLGTLQQWQSLVDGIHSRGMYVILDNTFATLGDLIGFEGYLNESAPFNAGEYSALYKTPRQYNDFGFSSSYNQTCQFPRFWNETGYPVASSVNDQFRGCFDGDFDQFGDTEAFGVYPDWRRQVTKFASVQDRLREWHDPVRQKLQIFYCMAISQLDIDGFRYDKATQSTPDALGAMNSYIRDCAARYGKHNFFIPGEITGGNSFGSIYLGRGRQPDMMPSNVSTAVSVASAGANASDRYSIRQQNHQSLDSAAFHYTFYRALVRFLGMDGSLEAAYDAPENWVDMWQTFLLTNDFSNPSTGSFDPRHMYGVTNQDVFRWPAVANGTQRQLLGHFISTILMPGIPLLLYGEEQSFYVLDNTAPNYVFGRQPMSSSIAWQQHGCYSLSSLQYYNWPLDKARHGCEDETVSFDHRDPSAPVRNAVKHMFYLRDVFPVLTDGFWLQQLSNQTVAVQYPGSSGRVTETGMWSIVRSGVPGIQNFDQSVWLLYSNMNDTHNFTFDCTDADSTLFTKALLSPFDASTTVRNLFPPFDNITLVDSAVRLGLNGSGSRNGCTPSMRLKAYEFRAYVPIDAWRGILPAITSFKPGHDARIRSHSDLGTAESVDIQFDFTITMDCDSVTKSISFETSAHAAQKPNIRPGSVRCSNVNGSSAIPEYSGILQSSFTWQATLDSVVHGIHAIYVNNPQDVTRTVSTNSTDKFMLRVGRSENPLVFAASANYSSTLIVQQDDTDLTLRHTAPGAELWRYTTNWGSSYSQWMPYSGADTRVPFLPWNGTAKQAWQGSHVRVEYWNHIASSADHVVEADAGPHSHKRRFPHLTVQGPFNEYGFDAGPRSDMDLVDDFTWGFHFLTEWPAILQINVWGINPDKQPDKTFVMGDVDGDSVLDRQPPNALAASIINITEPPPLSSVAWRLHLDDGTMRFQLTPAGSSTRQLAIFVCLWVAPVFFGIFATIAFKRSFYTVKREMFGLVQRTPLLSRIMQKMMAPKPSLPLIERVVSAPPVPVTTMPVAPRRTVLIATMEYDIEDWGIKIKIGGLGVMAQLMGKNLTHQDLIWVVPKVGDVEYPDGEIAEPMTVKVMGKAYKVIVHYHRLKNITYVLLDAPVFRAQSKSDPYPSRMDDMSSAIYYSAWNQAIAQTIERFPIDVYHINDYHGCVAPLYLLPSTIPVCLSLHNAEFQGLWPMRTPQECDEVAKVFNIPSVFVRQFIQFGTVFNLLHAGASYLRVYQQGFGAVGVSKKYGVRSYLRYPIFWGLKKVGQLPNPDPTDTADWDKKLPREQDIMVDEDFESRRPALKREAQEWAGLKVDHKADLFVFVGRWSTQKGIDLIADVFPSILETYPSAQLVCVGPIIDLYGRFAAAKLDRMMKVYPGRVFSRPVFTALPPCIFSGADFALIPSRDEPFGLVAVEFGRKGAIGVGARVGGLGQMPGWWYTIESMQTPHLLEQFKMAICGAITSKPSLRATMRARSAKQRFPVAQWKEDLEILQSTAIRVHAKGPVDPVEAPRPPPKMYNKLRRRTKYTYKFDTYESQKEFADPFPSETASITSAADYEPTLDESWMDPDYSTTVASSGIGTLRSSMAPEIYIASPGSSHTEPIRHDTAADRSQFVEDLATRLQAEPEEYENSSGSDGRFESTNESVQASGISSPHPVLSEARAVSMIRAYRADQDVSNTRPALASDTIVGKRSDFKLQNVDPFFTDPTGGYLKTYEKNLANLNGSNSESRLCIEEYLMKSEKAFFRQYRERKLGYKIGEKQHSRLASTTTLAASVAFPEPEANDLRKDEWGVPDTHVPPHGLKRLMQARVGDWPVYAFFLVIGQIIAANSYQIILLTGQVGQDAAQVYAISTIYAVSSIAWWLLFRRIGSRICLSLPFGFYGLAFLLIGLARFAPPGTSRSWLNHVGSGAYAIGSASGVFFFVLNFGDEGGSQVKSWIYRACVVQGIQQVYVVVLWFWGYHVNRVSSTGQPSAARAFANTPWMTVIGVTLTVLLWALGILLWATLPSYYREVPGVVPDFYRALLRRKIILWFFGAVLVQNFFLATQYGRSWAFLFASQHVAWWTVFVLVVFFFIVVWIAVMYGFYRLTMTHTWILPIFVLGLGAPRWAQIWWGASGMAVWLPWAPGGYIGSALLARCLWLWLGLLDMLQGVGIGLILLLTLTRVHVLFALVVAQSLGAAMTAIARACSPAKLGPGPVFPDLTEGNGGLKNAWFWIGLLMNLGLCFGYLKFFRKEQLTKP